MTTYRRFSSNQTRANNSSFTGAFERILEAGEEVAIAIISAFQSTAFQNNAFQIGKILTGGHGIDRPLLDDTSESIPYKPGGPIHSTGSRRP